MRPRPASEARILVVDDNAALLDNVAEILQGAGYAVSGAGSCAAALDLAPLKEAVGSDPAKLRRYLDLFTSSAAELLAQVRPAVEKRDAATVGRLAHSLKGTCGSVGARQMVLLAGALEAAVERADWAAVSGLGKDLEACFGLTKMAAGVV